MNTIELTNITKQYLDGHEENTILKDLNFQAEAGEFIAIIGPSGTGKSTFLTIAGGLQQPTSGQVMINNKLLNNLSKKELANFRFHEIGFILQSSNLIPFLTVKEQFQLMDKVAKESHPERLKNILDQLNITHIQNQYPSDISGGERQRVAIAKALYLKPSIILADEPTASLDSKRAFEVAKLLDEETKKHNTTTIMVTHDTRLIDYCDKVYYLNNGQLEPFQEGVHHV